MNMKYLFFFLFSVASASLGAQVIKDTVYQISQNGKFYERRETENADGSGAITTTLIGDTSTIFAQYFQQFEREGYRMANDAQSVVRFPQLFTGMADRRDMVLQTTGRDILDTMAVRYAQSLMIQGWTITLNGVDSAVTFSISAATQLRYQITGQPARNAYIISNTMRLANFNGTGENMDIFKMPGGNWTSVDGRTKLKFPGNTGLLKNALKAAKAAIAPLPVPEKTKSGVFLEYLIDKFGNITFFAGEAVALKKSGAKYIILLDGRTFELTEKKK